MQIDFWEHNADQWSQVIDSGEFKSRPITNAAILDQIRKLNLKSLLDIGCGEGWLGEALKLQGLDYLGIDGSKNLIEIAKSKYQASYEQASYDDIVCGWKPDCKFDGVVFNFSLLEQNISEILRASSLYLNYDGVLIIQTLHPCFNLNPYQDGWHQEDFKSSQIRFSGKMPWFGRTLGSWIETFKSCDLNIEEIVEPVSDGLAVSIIYILKCNQRSHV